MKKLISAIVALAMIFALSCTAFAAELPEDTPSVGPVVSTDASDEVSPRSTISGYAKGTISKDSPHVTIFPSEASGWGGLGVTVKLTCSQNLTLELYILEYDTYRLVLDDGIVRTNQENYFNDLQHRSGYYYIFTFVNIPEGVTIDYEIWMYG